MTRPLFPEITVNGTVLSAAAIAAEAQNHPAPAGKPGLAWRRAAGSSRSASVATLPLCR